MYLYLGKELGRPGLVLVNQGKVDVRVTCFALWQEQVTLVMTASWACQRPPAEYIARIWMVCLGMLMVFQQTVCILVTHLTQH